MQHAAVIYSALLLYNIPRCKLIYKPFLFRMDTGLFSVFLFIPCFPHTTITSIPRLDWNWWQSVIFCFHGTQSNGRFQFSPYMSTHCPSIELACPSWKMLLSRFPWHLYCSLLPASLIPSSQTPLSFPLLPMTSQCYSWWPGPGSSAFKWLSLSMWRSITCGT